MSPGLPSNFLDAEYPPKADLRKDVSKPLPKVAPGTIDPASMAGDAPIAEAKTVLRSFNEALASNDAAALANCLYDEQAYWRDFGALTSHLRTFKAPRVVAAALLDTIALRGLEGDIELAGDAHFAVLSPVMMFIDAGIKLRTTSPALDCSGKFVLLPTKSEESGEAVGWKIWVLSTWVEELIDHPADEALLLAPSRKLDGSEVMETDVLIIGGGTSGLISAARLKALGVESIVLDSNAHVGDAWGKRFDSLTFHVPTSNCELPYASYGKELQSPHRLTRDEVAKHMHQYAADFHLNVILRAGIRSTVFNAIEKKWTIKFRTGDGEETRTIFSKHLVQATGLGCRKPYLPPMDNEKSYKGTSIHSVQFRNAHVLAKKGTKSVAVIGSANTAFDIMRDCYNAGLKTTMVARSPTYVFPYEYIMDSHGIGAYDMMPVEAADRLINTLPTGIDGQFSHGLFAHLASQEPDRYLALSQAGFPVLDSRDPSFNVQHHLLERAGGHYIDVGGTELIASGKVAVRGLVEPIGYTETGLRLSDGSALEADAVIWCTGYADKDVRVTARDMLGAEEPREGYKKGDLGPADIAARLDASWGVDAEGEVRGVWKRHLRMENYWTMGGVIQHQRWWSRPMTQQIKLALEGSLPPAYRDTPVPT
ncbi:FAD/NAD(P)-binding domain-containing protein [Ophiobolus disseminans]|uniref:FAD/NAD(P)-binding domain-containing protein n=1 Tax=Ophiobolus disseminans TaxID=1469910 RepID=A0A6A6ZTB6_9PLEO|nr:FAD/NAD(P)-binding domain-containing protein [Ophiobolus disseminans]